jgi:hypothetical protein
MTPPSLLVFISDVHLTRPSVDLSSVHHRTQETPLGLPSGVHLRCSSQLTLDLLVVMISADTGPPGVVYLRSQVFISAEDNRPLGGHISRHLP